MPFNFWHYTICDKIYTCLKFKVDNKQINVKGKLFWKFGLKFVKKVAYLSTKLLLEKVQKQNKKFKSHEKVNNFFVASGDKISSFSGVLKLSQNFFMNFSWISHHICLTLSCLKYDFLITFSWHSYDFLLAFLCLSYDFWFTF